MKTACHLYFAFLFLLSSFVSSAQVPVLNSYPSSSNIIFLDFDGHVVNGTSWNSDGPIICDAATLNASQITTIFNRIAEDYRPFTINVTTDSTVYWAAPANRRMRIVLTPSSSWYGSAGGVAYINSFSWGDNTPCFVFTALLNNNVKNIAEAASHEAGHTLGLRHQSAYDAVCNKTSEYNAGSGAGEIGWAPIMGVGYYQNMTLWNYGANPFGCNSYQDDLSIITRASNGISFRPDDHGNAVADASTINFGNDSLSVGGVIEQPGDVDAVKFTTPSFGQLRLQALPYAVASASTGSNIDIEMELLNEAGNLVGRYNPANVLSSSIDTFLQAGTYYLLLKGKGNMYAPNYASLGSYSINGSFRTVDPLAVHKLQLKGSTEKTQHQLSWEIVADEKIVSQTLETSKNGKDFQALSLFGQSTRTYTYSPSITSLLYYRLRVAFDNGRNHYSNIIALRHNGSNARPFLLGNTGNENISVSSPSVYSYMIHDISGRTLVKGNLLQGINSIYVPSSSKGIYIIQFQKEGEVYSEKFVIR